MSDTIQTFDEMLRDGHLPQRITTPVRNQLRTLIAQRDAAIRADERAKALEEAASVCEAHRKLWARDSKREGDYNFAKAVAGATCRNDICALARPSAEPDAAEESEDD